MNKILVMLILFLIFFSSCKKDKQGNNPTIALPTLTTKPTFTISGRPMVISGGNIIDSGGASVNARGICWSTTANPTIADSKNLEGFGIGEYASTMFGLSSATSYHVRAFATNSAGTAYGNDVSFTTGSIVLPPPNSIPILSTTTVFNIEDTKAISGGNILNAGSAITSRGVCWSVNHNPTISNSKTVDGNGTGSFTSNITNLFANTTYYVRAYATNSTGTGYGDEISFTTDYASIKIGTQTWMATNLITNKYNDGTDIITDLTDDQWKSTNSGAYTYYNNSQGNQALYGNLYNWYAVNSGKLAPKGWHIPSAAEWQTLIDFLGGASIAGGALKATAFWNNPNTGATNSSKFLALPGGGRGGIDGFYGIGNYGYYWTSTVVNSNYVNDVMLFYDKNKVDISIAGREFGLSVRCIKD